MRKGKTGLYIVLAVLVGLAIIFLLRKNDDDVINIPPVSTSTQPS